MVWVSVIDRSSAMVSVYLASFPGPFFSNGVEEKNYPLVHIIMDTWDYCSHSIVQISRRYNDTFFTTKQ